MLVTAEPSAGVGGKVVEFGLQLSDSQRLPIDAKWTALAELEALEAAVTRSRATRARATSSAPSPRGRRRSRNTSIRS